MRKTRRQEGERTCRPSASDRPRRMQSRPTPRPDLVGSPAESARRARRHRGDQAAEARLLPASRFEAVRGLGQLFVEDATTSYESGKYAHHGRDEVVSFLSDSLGDRAIVHEHLGHHPEIVLTGEHHGRRQLVPARPGHRARRRLRARRNGDLHRRVREGRRRLADPPHRLRAGVRGAEEALDR